MMEIETNVYFGGVEGMGGTVKEPEDAGGVLNFHQGSSGMDMHICKKHYVQMYAYGYI